MTGFIMKSNWNCALSTFQPRGEFEFISINTSLTAPLKANALTIYCLERVPRMRVFRTIYLCKVCVFFLNKFVNSIFETRCIYTYVRSRCALNKGIIVKFDVGIIRIRPICHVDCIGSR